MKDNKYFKIEKEGLHFQQLVSILLPTLGCSIIIILSILSEDWSESWSRFRIQHYFPLIDWLIDFNDVHEAEQPKGPRE